MNYLENLNQEQKKANYFKGKTDWPPDMKEKQVKKEDEGNKRGDSPQN